MLTKLVIIGSAVFLAASLVAPIAEGIRRLFYPHEHLDPQTGDVELFLRALIVALFLLGIFIWLGFKYPFLYKIYCAIALLTVLLIIREDITDCIVNRYLNTKMEIAYKAACKKLNIDKADNTSEAITDAIKNDNFEFVKALVERGMPVNIELDTRNHTPLWYAARGGHTEIADYLIKRGANYERNYFSGGQTCILDVAVESGNISTVKLFLDMGFNIEGINQNGINDYRGTPLFFAARNDDFEMVKFLIAGGADAKRVHMHHLSKSEDGIIEYLIAHGAKNNKR
jgi:hypothetical protein